MIVNEGEGVREIASEWARENLACAAAVSSVSGATVEVLEWCKVALWTGWEKVETLIEQGSCEELEAAGRRVLWGMGRVVIGTLLLADPKADGGLAAVEAVRRWADGSIEGRGSTLGGWKAGRLVMTGKEMKLWFSETRQWPERGWTVPINSEFTLLSYTLSVHF
jgi:hypothetical protein